MVRCERCRLITSEFAFSGKSEPGSSDTSEPASESASNASSFTLSNASRFAPREIILHDFSGLEKSARQGCDLCSLLRYHLIHQWSNIRMLSQDGPITLRSSLGTFWVGGPTYECRLDWEEYNERDVDLKSSVDPVRGIARLAPLEITGDLRHLVGEVIRPWIERCRSEPLVDGHQSHRFCNQEESPAKCPSRSGPPLLPTRVIDVGQTDRNPHLYIPALEEEDYGHYLILSYCWGMGNGPARTTKANVEARRNEIEFQTLPKTIQDAITVTRALGERFLWVDAVCIIQPEDGDKTDWTNEAPQMRQYYQNALCTICATSARDSSEGFLHERPAQRYPVTSCVLEPWTDPARPTGPRRTVCIRPAEKSSFFTSVRSSPLSDRAWTLQERALSQRLLHWAENELFWECSTFIASESSDVQEPSQDPHMKLGTMINRSRDEILGTEWLRFVTRYSNMGLTFESDRLVALMGLVERIQQLFSDEHLFGLWQSQLLSGLSWIADHGEQAIERTRIAPSWSWASCGERIRFYQLTGFGGADSTDSLEWLVEVEGIHGELDIHRFSRTESECCLRLKGIVQKIVFTAQMSSFRSRRHREASYKNVGEEICFDSPERVPPFPGALDCLLLVVMTYTWRSKAWLGVIILERVNEVDNKYRRIGFAGFEETDTSWRLNGQRSTVEII